MHICHCYKNFQLSEGGVEQVILGLAREHMKLGHKISVLAATIPGQPTRELLDGIEVVRTKPLFTIFKVPIMPFYYRCLNEIDADIIHTHATIPGVTDISILFAARKKKPSLVYYHFDGNADGVIGSIFAGIYNSVINRFAISKANKVTATSRSYAETSPVLKYRLNNVSVIPNGVDPASFNPDIKEGNIREKYGLPGERIIFFAGRFVKYKGLEYLIRAMKYVDKGTLVVAGKGPQETYLRKLIQKQQINNVKFIGQIPHEELPRLFRASDVYVLPAITRGENFGISALEAMACGTPVIFSDFPWLRELVTPKCGISFRPKDSTGLATAINTILSDNNLRLAMGKAARINAEQYGWGIVAKKVLQLYQELLP